MDGYVIDTSIFVAAEQDRPLGAPPAGDGSTSVATLTELGVGVRRAAGLMDTTIAATALAHDLAVWTQDDDFDVLAELAPGLRVHRG